jgi:glyoxylase-like metal-dependent hydrolase (beta-lactamase superfamily II)
MNVLLALALLLQVATTTPALNPAEFPKYKKLAENVYVWSDVHPSGLYTTNNLIVITSDGVLVADGQKDAETTKKMVDWISTMTDQPIKVVVIGSEHGDHTGGNSSFPPTAAFIKSPLPQGKQSTLKMGSTNVHVLDRGRAHTGTDLVVYLPAEKILFTSEAYSHRIFPNMRAAVPAEWVQTIKNIRAIDANMIVPGHGFIEDGPAMKASLAEFEQALQHIVTEVTRLHKTGATVEAATKQGNWGRYGAWTARDRNAPVAVQRVYDAINGTLK